MLVFTAVLVILYGLFIGSFVTVITSDGECTFEEQHYSKKILVRASIFDLTQLII